MAKPKTKKASPVLMDALSALMEPAPKGQPIDKDALEAQISAILGRKVEGYTNQSGTEYRYGYARVMVPGLGRGGMVATAKGRKEGDASHEGVTAARSLCQRATPSAPWRRGSLTS